MRTDLRLSWLLTSGSDRREWWRISLTSLGAACVAAFAGMAAAVASVRGYANLPVAQGLLNNPGQRPGVVLALLCLLIPALGFLGQCTRLGAVTATAARPGCGWQVPIRAGCGGSPR
ncbi:hypothetical protein [Streptomyces yanii]|uniref:ABC transporter permease n=1 Tax=Streptomyces yanii TaxID=78510 RepID=A0ABV5R0M1_9ACTN